MVLLTRHDPILEADLAAPIPVGRRSVTFGLAAFSERQLVETAEAVADKWDAVGEGATLLAVGTDQAPNRVVVEVAEQVPASLPDALRAAFIVPIDVREGIRTRDVHCTTRDHCHAPTSSGIRLYKGVIDSQHECALGAHIRIGTDERFVTSGHCGFTGSNNWLHPGIAGNHILGAETGQTLYVNGGQDIMVVQLDNDAESSDNIFPCCGDITGIGSPILNETLCVSLAETNTSPCGTVTQTWVKYLSDTPDPDWMVWGARVAIIAIPGDSGGPVYRLTDDPPLQARAVGVLATEFGHFTRLDMSLDDWGATVVN